MYEPDNIMRLRIDIFHDLDIIIRLLNYQVIVEFIINFGRYVPTRQQYWRRG